LRQAHETGVALGGTTAHRAVVDDRDVGTLLVEEQRRMETDKASSDDDDHDSAD
jgi:formyltetrahydrofolate hydrolase